MCFRHSEYVPRDLAFGNPRLLPAAGRFASPLLAIQPSTLPFIGQQPPFHTQFDGRTGTEHSKSGLVACLLGIGHRQSGLGACHKGIERSQSGLGAGLTVIEHSQ